MGLMGLVGLTNSCSNDEEPAKGQAETSEAPVAEVRSLATYFDEYVARSRAWTYPTYGDSTYTEYENGIQPIGIAFTQNDKAALKGTFSTYTKNGETTWRLIVTDAERSVDEIDAGEYYLYGFIPSTNGIILNVTDQDGKNGDGSGANYSEGAKVTLNNVPTVMSEDLCVVIGAKHGFKQGDNYYDGDYTDTNGNGQYDDGETRTNRLRRGDFKYTAKQINKKNTETAKDNNVFLLFDHLYASLRIEMKVESNYAALRTIKLKALRLSTKAGGETSREYTTITASLKANDGSKSPITGITYEQTGDIIGVDGLTFWWSDDGEALTTEYTARAGNFMPHNISTLVLTSVYDVYDRKGNLTRENCSATNTMVLKDLFTEQTTTQRGKRYTVKMTIQPTYLYVLSDPDLDNPTVSVE